MPAAVGFSVAAAAPPWSNDLLWAGVSAGDALADGFDPFAADAPN
jgi:hypothetical protein